MAIDLSKLKIDKSSSLPSGKKPAGKKRIVVIAGAAALLVAVLVFSGILSPSVKTEVVTVTQLYPTQTFTSLNASGYVVAQRKAAVAAKITGRLVELKVEEGSRIKKGEIIARLEADDAIASQSQAAANVAQSQAELADATLNYRRAQELVKKEYIAKSDADAAEARYRKAIANVAAAKAGLQSARVSVDYSLLRAPFDAVVLTKNADIGDIVSPLSAATSAKAAVVTIADMGSLQVEVDVSESNIGKVKMGQPCEILLDALPEKRFRGAVYMIVPTADRTKASVMVKVRFVEEDARVLPEMSAKVAFLQREASPEEASARTVVKPSSIVTRGDRKLVYLVRDNRAVEAVVTLGPQLGDYVEVVSGLKAGEKIVAKPTDSIRNGVQIATDEK